MLQPAAVPAFAQSAPAQPAPPPIAQELVREGDFALRLEAALGLEKSADEVGAESRLGNLGILPRNGWIADYPVTPDILAELGKAVAGAADAGRIPLARDEALKRFNMVAAGEDLPIQPYSRDETAAAPPESAGQYPNPALINDYYSGEGPPVITYYAPPPDYYYLYSWIPFPFWCYGFWFPGYFILHDFHRPFFFNHHVAFISNHFNDLSAHRVFRVDPVARFNGRTFAGIGVTNRSGFISTGVSGSATRIFNAPRTLGGPGTASSGASRNGGAWGTRTYRSGYAASAGGSRGTASFQGGRPATSSFSGGRSFASSSHGGSSMAPATHSGAASAPSSHGGFHGGGASTSSSHAGSHGGGWRR